MKSRNQVVKKISATLLNVAKMVTETNQGNENRRRRREQVKKMQFREFFLRNRKIGAGEVKVKIIWSGKKVVRRFSFGRKSRCFISIGSQNVVGKKA